MTDKKTNPLIVITPETKKKLDKIGNKGDTYNDVIIKILEYWMKGGEMK